jgi:hypothetical protein
MISFSGGGACEDDFSPAASLDGGGVAVGSFTSSGDSDVTLIFFLTHQSDGSIAEAA